MTQEQLLAVRDEILSRLPENIFLKIGDVSQCRVILNPRMKTTAGRAHTRKNLVELNPKLFDHEIIEFMNTFAHELAHLIEFKLYGRTNHGCKFQAIMRLMGYEPTRAHTLPWKVNSHRVVCYATCKCVGRKFEIKPRKYRAMLSGSHYRCTTCYSRLKLEGVG